MAARGRPTSQAATGDRPRFRDRPPEDYRNPEANPFVQSHRSFGPELLTADDAWQSRGAWGALFGREAPLHVEIGSGNGFFLAALGTQRPDINVLGIELRYKRTVLCGRKIREAGLQYAKIARYHAAYLGDLFDPGSLSALYVNHPDPWPKDRHEKHRLIARWFLEDAVRLLQPGAVFRLKTDFLPHIEEALASIDGLPLSVTGRSDDVNGRGVPWGADIETNYQRKFAVRGLPVYALELTRG